MTMSKLYDKNENVVFLGLLLMQLMVYIDQRIGGSITTISTWSFVFVVYRWSLRLGGSRIRLWSPWKTSALKRDHDVWEVNNSSRGRIRKSRVKFYSARSTVLSRNTRSITVQRKLKLTAAHLHTHRVNNNAVFRIDITVRPYLVYLW